MTSSLLLAPAPVDIALPALPEGRAWLRALLAWPASWFTPRRPLPVVSIEERHARLQASTPPEGWLALQDGLSTVGDAGTWTSFAARGSMALAVGGVHGEDRGHAFRAFRDQTTALGLARQAVYPVRRGDLAPARAAGFRVEPVAIESWVDLEGFTMRGKAFADLRQMRNRANKRGVVVEEIDPAAWQPQIQGAWHRFQAAKGVPWQVRWLSGGPVSTRAFGHRTFVAHVDGALQAFCTMLPGPAGTASLDVMCRDPDAIPGSMEGLLVHVLERLRDDGLTSVSLGPSPLAGGSADSVPGVLGSAMRWAWGSETGDRWFGFRQLAAFKEKFRPRHETVYLGISPGWSPWSLYLTARIWALGD